MDLGLAGRAYVVTGGSRGVGRALVATLLAEGACVATCARDATALRDTWADTDRLLLRAADVRGHEAMRVFVAEAAAEFGRLDGVVANAGTGATGGVLTTAPKVWRDQYDIKIAGVLNVVEPSVEHLTSSDSASVVLVNGVTAHAPEPDMAAVSAARAAVAAVATMLATTLVLHGIRVNTVNLGAIRTERQRDRYEVSGSDLSYDEWCAREAVRRGIPAGRFGLPEEVAPIVAMLLSPLSSYVLGTTVDVGGGLGA